MKIFLQAIYSVALLSLLFAWQEVNAAKIVPQIVHTKSESVVEFYLDTEGQAINAIEGALNFKGEGFRVNSIEERNGVVTFWIVRPEIAIDESEVKWMGIIPGGFDVVLGPTGDRQPGKLFGVVISRNEDGIGNIEGEINISHLVENNESNSEIFVEPISFKFNWDKNENLSIDNRLDDSNDTTPPEAFEVFILDEEKALGDGTFIAWNTRDTESGIDHYEVKIGNDKYRRAESPYPLDNSVKDGVLYVRAIDRAGNERTVSLALDADPKSGTFDWVLVVSLVITLLALFYIWKKSSLKLQY